MIRSVLIANRGEIAVRVARTCRELGLRVIAVHSEPDGDSAVTRLADETVQIGPGPAKASYLNIPAVIEAARMSGADAIHPGYGFLSENADFAEVCEQAGLVFIGPPAPVIAALGDKASARAIMLNAGLPLLPGSREPLESADQAVALVAEIGCPVILKAVAGGGGRAMSIVRDPAEVPEAFARTRASAASLFGDGRLYLERYLDSARHVEVQILADTHGSVVHLGARDCSVQRRHQKLVEESPVTGVPPGLVAEMQDAAVHGAKAAGYVGAGTFEFLVDVGAGFAFMEVNCRLQVEHAVSEMVTGMDLVREQLRIADGEPLGYTQHDITLRGVAIECRINAEDPDRDFRPTAGVLEECRFPMGPFVRVDTHIEPGYDISPFYDSMLAKVIVWAPDRDQALARMRRALDEVRVTGAGIATTTSLLRRVVDDPAFESGRHDTSLLAAMSAS